MSLESRRFMELVRFQKQNLIKYYLLLRDGDGLLVYHEGDALVEWRGGQGTGVGEVTVTLCNTNSSMIFKNGQTEIKTILFLRIPLYKFFH